jgi:phosphoribosylformylglycinamidine synthase
MYAKSAGNLLYVVGDTFDELGASHYYDLFGEIGNCVPKVNTLKAKKIFNALSLASQSRLVSAMHDCSDGGLAVAMAEMAFSGALGLDMFLSGVPYKSERANNASILFSESNSRFVVEVEPKNRKKFERLLKGISFGLAGCFNAGKYFKVYGLDGKVCINADINKLKDAWQKPLKW